MRAGVYTIHQSLTAEAAAVLKLALALATRRGHAQVTPLHVAFALLSSSCSPHQHHHPGGGGGAAYGLLRRACLRSHPAAAQHPFQCRALELCFNVALNRLSTSGPHSPPPHSSGPPFASSLIQPSPTLSNALVAALKRAQANQRRGCVDLQQPPPVTLQQQQQQQPLLAIKVELDQLIISILDDPSVSRVMREAGFSSATVKANLEEESAHMCINSSSSSPPPPVIPPHFFLDNNSSGIGGFGMWPAQFLAPPPGAAAPHCQEDVRAVLEVMVRKQGRRTNPVVVGDSVSMAEAVAGELLRRLERGEVPEELAGAHLLKLQLSYVHVRLMNRADVDAKAAELRRSVDAVQVQRAGLVVYVGDLRWALDEDPAAADHTASSYSPVEHMVAELGRLLDDLRASAPPRGRVWLLATASYQTYMRCQQRRRQPSLETAWALQAVAVPAGSGTGLALNNLHSSSAPTPSAAAMQQAMATTRQQLAQGPVAMAAEAKALGGEQEEKLLLCSECNRNYEREASVVKVEADEEGPRFGLPAWLVLENKPPVDHRMQHKESYLIELKRKWSRLCGKLHLWGNSQQHDPYSASVFGSGLPAASPSSWWPSPCLPPGSQSKPSIAGFLGLEGLMEHGRRWSPPSPLPCPGLMDPHCPDVKTTLALGTVLPLSDTATSDGRARGRDDGLAHELERRLRKNMPWQPADTVAEIVEAVAGGRSYGKKGVWLYLKGSDHAAQQRAAAVIAETCCGSADQIVAADPKRFSCAEDFCSDVVSRASRIGSTKFVLVIHDVERASRPVVECLVAASKRGCITDHFGQELYLSESVVIVTTSEFAHGASDVISLRLRTSSSPRDFKRKEENDSPSRECKRARHDAGGHGIDLNLNLCVGSDSDDDGVPSDITHESDTRERGQPHDLLESIATSVFTLDKGADADQRAAAAIRAVLVGALRREVQLDNQAAEALVAASGHFLDEVLERWAAEVFEPAAAAAAAAGNGGKVVILGIGPGGGARVSGYMGSALPSRVLVE
ncbi:protein SMAX1-LIKE 4 [Lolium perenne]|uniref:protein SMAX1-LIKE 4 n=1 Tax=Lolium perenne TaxID=4522 RepID=UPI0021EA3EDA|nr:protein SMAX1-LIKE 4-like [Lolium perenne]